MLPVCASDAYFKKEEKQKAFSFVKVNLPACTTIAQ
jgi:hypothetical protein